MLSHRGFTLIELVVLLLVVGLLSVFAFQRLGSVTGLKAAAFTDKLRADLRYAQNVAMTRNRRTRVFFNGVGTAPAAGYAVVVDGAAGLCNAFTAVADPAGTGNLTVTLATGDYAGITVTPNTSSCLEYDSLGAPYNCFAGPASCSATAAGMTFTVPAASAAVNTIAVAAGTGAVN